VFGGGLVGLLIENGVNSGRDNAGLGDWVFNESNGFEMGVLHVPLHCVIRITQCNGTCNFESGYGFQATITIYGVW
jgi:hypothetical protein